MYLGNSNPKAFIEYSNTINGVCNNINDYNLKRMIIDINTNKKFQTIMKELICRCRKLNISFVFITQLYFSVPNEVRLNSTYYLKMKIHNKRELQSIVINHSADIDYKDFMIIYKKCTSESFFFKYQCYITS